MATELGIRVLCYLLGCYLGDGHALFKAPNSWSLRIACDRRFPGITGEIIAAAEALFPPRRARRWPASGGSSEVVTISHRHVRDAFPQHEQGGSPCGGSRSIRGSWN